MISKELDLILKDLHSLSLKDLQILYMYYNVNSDIELISKIYNSTTLSPLALGNTEAAMTTLIYKGLLPSIFDAINENNINLVKEIISSPGFDIDTQLSNGDTALIKSILKNNTEIAKYLIDSGANLDLQSNYKNTALILATIRGANKNEITKYLINPPNRKGAKLDLQNENGDTALIYAIKLGNDEITKYLIEKKANIDLKNKDEKTALFFAVDENNNEIVKYLIDKGAKLDEKILLLIDMKRSTDLLFFIIDKDVKVPKEIMNEMPNYVNFKVYTLQQQIKVLKSVLSSEETELLNTNCESQNIAKLEKCIEMIKDAIKYRPGGKELRKLEKNIKNIPISKNKFYFY